MTTPDGLSDNQLRGFVEKLLCSVDAVNGVEHIISTIEGIAGESNVEWVPVGGSTNNAGLGRTTGPMGSIIEKPTNAIDGYSDLRRGDQTTATDVHELVEEAYNGDERVYMAFDGDSPKGPGESDINVMVADKGTGQSPSTFNVFFDALDAGEYKKGCPYFHGCRGVGGMAALGHTKGGHQVVASASADKPNVWTVGVVRQSDDGTYQYLTIDGSFPTFNGTLTLGDGLGEMEHGTAVKLYGYEFGRSPNRATNAAFRRRLGVEFENPAVPIHLLEQRASTDDGSEYIYRGIEAAATGPYSPAFYEPVRKQVHVEGLGPIEIVALGAKPKEERRSIAADAETSVPNDDLVSLNRFFAHSQRDRVLISANGRVHATESRHVLGSRGNLDAVNDSMYVLVRMKEPPVSVEDGPFKLGRDGFADTQAQNDLRDAVFAAIRGSETIQSWDAEHTSEDEGEATQEPMMPAISAEQTTLTLDADEETVSVDVACQNLSDDPLFSVTGENLQVVDTSWEGETATITIRATSDRILSGAVLEETANVATDALSVRPSWAVEETATKCSDTALPDLFDGNLEEVHARTLRRLDNDTIAPAAAYIVEDHGLDGLLSDLPDVMHDATALLKRLGVEAGTEDPSQWARNKVGLLFEVLAYLGLVHACQSNGLTVYHEPSIDEFAGVNHGGEREPDTDIVLTPDATEEDAPLYVLSLKTSLKDRVAQMAYWSRVFRDARASCVDDGCPVGADGGAIECDCPVYYKYVTLSRDGTPNDALLNEMDGGYVPASKQSDETDEQRMLGDLCDDVARWDTNIDADATKPTRQDTLFARMKRQVARATGLLAR